MMPSIETMLYQMCIDQLAMANVFYCSDLHLPTNAKGAASNISYIRIDSFLSSICLQ